MCPEASCDSFARTVSRGKWAGHYSSETSSWGPTLEEQFFVQSIGFLRDQSCAMTNHGLLAHGCYGVCLTLNTGLSEYMWILTCSQHKKQNLMLIIHCWHPYFLRDHQATHSPILKLLNLANTTHIMANIECHMSNIHIGTENVDYLLMFIIFADKTVVSERGKY